MYQFDSWSWAWSQTRFRFFILQFGQLNLFVGTQWSYFKRLKPRRQLDFARSLIWSLTRNFNLLYKWFFGYQFVHFLQLRFVICNYSTDSCLLGILSLLWTLISPHQNWSFLFHLYYLNKWFPDWFCQMIGSRQVIKVYLSQTLW